MSRSSRAGADALALLAALALPLGSGLIGARGPVSVALDLGPNDHAYLRGFEPLYEIADGEATRWSQHAAAIVLPLEVSGGPVELSYRFARVLPQTAQVTVSLDERPIDRFECRGGRFETRRVRLDALARTPLRLGFAIDSHDRRGLGLKLDWVRFDVSEGARVRLERGAWLRTLAFVGLLLLLLRSAGFAPAAAYLLTLPAALVQAAAVMNAPLAAAHVSAALAFPALALAALVSLVARRWPGARWAVPLFLASYLAKGALIFNPGYYYPDAMNHRRYVFRMAEAQGGLVERGIEAQRRVNTAYPRFVAGRAYAFPYSPLLFVPFTWLPPDAGLVEDALRHVALAAAAAELLVVFGLAWRLFGAPAAAWAALIAALAPPMTNRLLLAMWPTVVGHLLDVLVIAAALGVARAPDRLRRWATLAGLTLASLLSYISSLFNLGAFLGAASLLDARLRPRLPLLLAAASALTVLLLYRPFTVLFVGEILPALLAGGTDGGGGAGAGAAAAAAQSGLLPALGRVAHFFGWGLPALALGGLVVARRRLPTAEFRVLAAWGLAFVVLVGLRAFGLGLFKDLKEILFVSPLVALLGGLALSSLAAGGVAGRRAAALVAVGLVVFAIGRGADDVARYDRTPHPGGPPAAPGVSARLAPAAAR